MPEPTPRLHLAMLGTLQLTADSAAVTLKGAKLRALVAQLGLAAGRVVSVDHLLDGLWGEDLPATAKNTLQYHVGVLRKALAEHGAAGALLTKDPGYSLQCDTDVDSFLHDMNAGTGALDQGQPERAAASLARALEHWRGPALADLRDFAFADSRGIALDEQRLTCVEAWTEAELACGRAEPLISKLQEFVTAHPTRERLWEQLMVTLYRTGRQDSALAAYRSVRAVLDRELGVEPSRRLQTVHQAILNQDPRLAPFSALVSPAAGHAETAVVAAGPSVHATLLAPRGQVVQLDSSSVVIGRQEDCDLVLHDEEASRRHAEVMPLGSGYAVEDLSSTNGTHVNGERLTAVRVLRDGDRIEIGTSVVRFVAGA